jgi:hypothetical protein
VHSLALSHVSTKMAELAYLQLKREGEDVTRKHALLFSYDYLYIFEELLLIWSKRASPLPLSLHSDACQGNNKGFSNKQMAT